MSDLDRRPEAETAYDDHLQRSERVWNRWSDWYRTSERDLEPARNDLIGALDLAPGDDVLEVGCGPGVNFATIREAIGPAGSLVAVEYSPEMVERATDRVETHGWENVTVVRADATTAALGGPYDAAIATLALSVMPDVERAVRNVHDALAPGAPLGVLDVRPVPSGPLRIANPFLRWFLRWYANWNPDGDVGEALEAVFGTVEGLETFAGGTLYSVTATRGEA